MPSITWNIELAALDKMIGEREAEGPYDKFDSNIYDSEEEHEQALQDFYERNCQTWDEED